MRNGTSRTAGHFTETANRLRKSKRDPGRILAAVEALEWRVLLSSVVPPTVATGAAASISATGATLNATVNANGSTTAASFQYSTEPSFATTIPATFVGGFADLFGVAVDAARDVFVTDAVGNAVEEILPNGTIKTLGSGFNDPLGVAVDAAGDVFVGDTKNNAVKEILPNGTIKTLGSGFDSPFGVAVDTAGDVFVADAGNYAFKEILPDGTIKTLGSGFQPLGVAVDAAGDAFVADRVNGAIKEFLPNGTIKTLASGFSYLKSVAVDAAGDVFVADETNAVYEVLPNGTVMTLASGFSLSGGVAVDAAGDVFATDVTRLVELSPPTVAAAPSPLNGSTATAVSGIVTGLLPGTTYYYRAVASNAGVTVAGAAKSFQSPWPPGHIFPPTVATGAASSISMAGATLNGTINANGSTTAARFQYSTDPSFAPSVSATLVEGFVAPQGVAVDAAGDVFVANTFNNAVKEILPNGTVKTLGSGFNRPWGVAVDAAGGVFVADTGNNAVKEILPNGTIKTLGSGFSNPTGLAVDAAGDVFVADTGNNAVKEILPNGTVKTVGFGFSNPTGLAVDAAGDVFVADSGNHRVMEILPIGAIMTLGSGFLYPQGVAVDAAGDVFVADTNNSAVKEILPNGTVMTLGSGFNRPIGVAVDAAGDVFVTDADNRVVELSPPTVAAMPSPLTGSTATSVSGTVTGLLPRTTYYYRAVASGAGGTVTGPAKSFQSLPPNFTISEGNKFFGTVANFTAGTQSKASDFYALITWGDGSRSNGVVVMDRAGVYRVTGVHTYAEAGKYITSVKITQSKVGVVTVSGSATVLDAPLVAGPARTLALTANQPFSGLVGTFVDKDPLNVRTTEYQGTVDWGDGTSPTAAVFVRMGNGQWKVLGGHTYATGGNYEVTLTIKDIDGAAPITDVVHVLVR